MTEGVTPRFERVPRRRVRLTERDLQAVAAVYDARYLTGRQIGRLLFGREDSSLARQRLRYLYDLDYLRKRLAGPNEPDIYYLGLAGRRYVAAQGLCERATADRVAGVSGEGVATPALMMAHELALGELYVAARLQCRRHGWTLHWKSARALELERLGMQPDGWLAVHAAATGEQDPQQAFLEYTAVMPSAAQMRGKLARYRAYWEATGNPAAVLWLTTTEAQVEGLLRAIRKSAYRDCFLVGLMGEVEAFLTAPIWRWGDTIGPENGRGRGVGGRVSWMQTK
jgi:hypothetical protein